MKKKIKLRFFGGAALVLMAALFAGSLLNKDQGLYKEETVLYVNTETGKTPEIDFGTYFPDEKYEYEQFSFEIEEEILKNPGTYEIPVYYKGNETKCKIQLRVKGEVLNELNIQGEAEFKNSPE